MPYQLTLQPVLERAVQLAEHQTVISRDADGLRRLTYGHLARRISRLVTLLGEFGCRPKDSIASLAWNHQRHLQLYFGVPLAGCVLHLVNPSLSKDQLVYVINDAQDKVLFVDDEFVPLVEDILPRIPFVQHIVTLSGQQKTSQRSSGIYDELLDQMPEGKWSAFIREMDAATMCYTSATTGRPKGVVYTHRMLYLHSLALGTVDSLGINRDDTVMPVVPMYHVHAWGLPFAATWFGARQVLPGPHPRASTIVDLIEQEAVTVTAAVPTVWFDVAQELQERPRSLTSLRMVLNGGSAVPLRTLKQYWEEFHLPMVHAYGLTETTPVVTVSHLRQAHHRLTPDQRFRIQERQGVVVAGLQWRVVGNDGVDVPWDDSTLGELWVKGPWVATAYYRGQVSEDEWLHTGDMVRVDQEGYLEIVDRRQDLIKSGGEWISSIALEHALMGHFQVQEAAVIGATDARWGERPVACIVPVSVAEEEESLCAGLRHFLQQSDAFPAWWIPDTFAVLDAIPRGATGKFDKAALRRQCASGSLRLTSVP